jgi:hypothetical protein
LGRWIALVHYEGEEERERERGREGEEGEWPLPREEAGVRNRGGSRVGGVFLAVFAMGARWVRSVEDGGCRWALMGDG